MSLLGRIWNLSIDTYGGMPLVALIDLAQLTLLGWVALEVYRAGREADGALDPAERKLQATRRAEIWRRRVRPVVMTLMLLGPGVGLAASTLLGALGMGALGEAMTSMTSQEVLMQAIGHAYREISYAYLLMVGGTAPMLIGPLAVLLARRIDEQAALARGGDREDLLLHTLQRILGAIETQSARAETDAGQTHQLLERLARPTLSPSTRQRVNP